MTRIVTPALDTATGATADVYAQIKKAAGKVPNTFATIGAHGPKPCRRFCRPTEFSPPDR